MTTLLIDNYDSFTFNLYQYLSELGARVVVVRNDAISVEECKNLQPVNIVISPGPGKPSESGISKEVIRAFEGKCPILGVCLGHQAMVEVYGGKVDIACEITHGKVSPIHHDNQGVFAGLPNPFNATRYHSLAAVEGTVPDVLQVTATCPAKTNPSFHIIQGVRHKRFTIEGVQFHPESIASDGGKQLLANFLNLRGGEW